MNSQFLKVTLDQNGTLLEGQHRLAAIAKMYTQTEDDTEREMSIYNMTMTIETVGVPEATKYLNSNRGNRKVSHHHVKKLANAITLGEWTPWHEGIAFDENGELVDGQHRLHAIIKTNTPIIIPVFRNVPRRGMLGGDDGRPKRNPDILAMHGFIRAKDLAAAGTIIHNIQSSGGRLSAGCRFLPMTRQQALAFAEQNPILGEYLKEGARTQHLIRSTVFAATKFIFMSIDPNDAIEFCDALQSGIGLAPGSPILACREWFARHNRRQARRDSSDRGMEVAILFKAWNLFRQGRSIRTLIFRTDRDQFPTPV